jgi:uncharacterized damage-inducible protein DinB
MSTLLATPPAADEYGAYYARYVGLVPAGDLLRLLPAQLDDTAALLDRFGEARADHRYAPGKWSVREVVGHLADTERVFAYRALRIARGDATPLPGFDQDAYVEHGGSGGRSLAGLVRELRAVRQATVALLGGLDDAALARRGTASGQPLTPRAAAYMIAGHELHHAAILRELYAVG